MFVLVTWALARLMPTWVVVFDGQAGLAGALVIIGVILMGAAVLEMNKSRTTIIPHRQPQALVVSGIFRFSRNPIYLGDFLVLSGAIIFLGAPLAVPLLWVFKWVIEKRFVLKEEDRLRAGFGDEFERWAKLTRRWL